MSTQNDCKLSSSLVKKDGYMFCEHVKIKDIQEDFARKLSQPSPIYVYSLAQLMKNVDSYKDALRGHSISNLLGYSIKANHNPEVSVD